VITLPLANGPERLVEFDAARFHAAVRNTSRTA
jgi:hypothetical protein